MGSRSETAGSLFDELTRKGSESFLMTEVLTQLVDLVGYNACLAKRNQHSLYWAVSRARDLRNEIDSLIVADGNNGSWEQYDRYIEMIPALEQ
jgi:hypothetical protein